MFVCVVGDLEHLLAYESERQRRVVPMMGGIDCLTRLYSNRIMLVVLLRNLGCHLAHSLKPIKVQHGGGNGAKMDMRSSGLL